MSCRSAGFQTADAAMVARHGGQTAGNFRTVCRLKVGDTAGWKTCATILAGARRVAGGDAAGGGRDGRDVRVDWLMCPICQQYNNFALARIHETADDLGIGRGRLIHGALPLAPCGEASATRQQAPLERHVYSDRCHQVRQAPAERHGFALTAPPLKDCGMQNAIQAAPKGGAPREAWLL